MDKSEINRGEWRQIQMKAIRKRHSVRAYIDRAIEPDTLSLLNQYINECNRESGFNIQLCANEPAAFSGAMARYSKFRNVKNYIAVVGKDDNSLDEKAGYYGEKIVLKAQELGLNTCWVALTFSKSKTKKTIKIKRGEKLLLVISLGYGETDGISHKGKTIEQLCRTDGKMPEWFRNGMEAVQLAPTARNQQKSIFHLTGDEVKAEAGTGFYTKVDLGIAKCHFEIGSGRKLMQEP